MVHGRRNERALGWPLGNMIKASQILVESSDQMASKFPPVLVCSFALTMSNSL